MIKPVYRFQSILTLHRHQLLEIHRKCQALESEIDDLKRQISVMTERCQKCVTRLLCRWQNHGDDMRRVSADDLALKNIRNRGLRREIQSIESSISVLTNQIEELTQRLKIGLRLKEDACREVSKFECHREMTNLKRKTADHRISKKSESETLELFRLKRKA